MDIVRRLRGPDGCPWDKKQTHETLAPYAIEEALELESALLKGDLDPILDELGDLFFQVVLHAQLLEEMGHGDLKSIAQKLSEKLVRRHPHVFGGAKLNTSEEVQAQWKAMKAQERKKTPTASPLGVKEGLPALRRSQRIGEKSREWKFDWNAPSEVWAKVEEEMAELKEAAPADREEELGDLFFSLVQWARHLDMDAEQSLQRANFKFERRFSKVLDLAKAEGLDWSALTPEEREDLWIRVKKGD